MILVIIASLHFYSQKDTFDILMCVMGINKEWHLKNLMPKNPTEKERIKLHKEHSKNCDCRPIPPRLQEKIKNSQ